MVLRCNSKLKDGETVHNLESTTTTMNKSVGASMEKHDLTRTKITMIKGKENKTLGWGRFRERHDDDRGESNGLSMKNKCTTNGYNRREVGLWDHLRVFSPTSGSSFFVYYSKTSLTSCFHNEHEGGEARKTSFIGSQDTFLKWRS